MENKFFSFAPVYVINLPKRKDRRVHIESLFYNYNIKDYHFIDAIDGDSDIYQMILDEYPQDFVTKQEISIFMSHIKAINYWLSNSASEYAIVCEDDISFETERYWGFSWDDFLHSIKNIDFDILQLSILFDEEYEIKLHKKISNEYSAACYLIKRNYAQEIIKKYIKNNKYDLSYSMEEVVADHMSIFKKEKCYSIPLFVTDLKLGTDNHMYNIVDEGEYFVPRKHAGLMDNKKRNIFFIESIRNTILMWKKNTLSLEELVKIEQ